MFAIRGHRDLPVGPFAGEMDAHTGHDGRTILQAERGQVQTTWQDTFRQEIKTETGRERTDIQYIELENFIGAEQKKKHRIFSFIVNCEYTCL